MIDSKVWFNTLFEALMARFYQGPGQRDFRIKTNLNASVTNDAGQRHSARVVDLSSGGLKLVLSVPLLKGQVVEVEIQGRVHPSTIRVDARTVWCREHATAYHCGMAFMSFNTTQSDTVVAFFSEEVHLEVSDSARRLRSPRHVTPRYKVRYAAAASSEVFEGELRNISQTGIRFSGPKEQPRDAVLNLTIETPGLESTQLSVTATVRRCTSLRKGTWDIGASMRPAGESDWGGLKQLLASLPR